MLFRTSRGNFGDDLNPWLWSRLAPEACEPSDPRLLVGIGTILSRSIPAEPVKMVFGSGCGDMPKPNLDPKWHFYAVRGPRSAAKLGLEPKAAVTDPGVLVSAVEPGHAPTKVFPISFMPHYQSYYEADWNVLCQRAGIHPIDPRKPVDDVLLELRQTSLLLTEAMHGAITADALRIPWIPVRLYPHFLEFKWRDWTESLELPLQVHAVPAVYERQLISTRGLQQAGKKLLANAGLGKVKWKQFRVTSSSAREVETTLAELRRIAKDEQPQLSAETVLASRKTQLLARLAGLREDWRSNVYQHECHRLAA